MAELIPLPLECEAPRFFVRCGSLSDDDLAKLARPHRHAWVAVEQTAYTGVIILPPASEEPLDRIAGMISDDDVDVIGFMWRGRYG